MLRRLLPALMFVVTAVVAACGPSPTEQFRSAVSVTVPRAHYAPEDTITFSLLNSSGSDVRFGLCPVIIQQRVGASWQQVTGPGFGCTNDMPAWRLQSGGTSAGVVPSFPNGLSDGEYRIRLFVTRDDNTSLQLTSNTFRVAL